MAGGPTHPPVQWGSEFLLRGWNSVEFEIDHFSHSIYILRLYGLFGNDVTSINIC
jgi:hypothetical protein